MTGFPFENVDWIQNVLPAAQNIIPPAFYTGELVLPEHEKPLDTFVELSGWGKVSESEGTFSPFLLQKLPSNVNLTEYTDFRE